MWGPVLAQILALVGPLVAEWLKRWLDNRMKDAADKLGVPFGNTGKDSARLLQRVHDDIPWWNVFLMGRKRFVKSLIDKVPVALMAGHGLTEPEVAAIQTAARDA